MSKHWTEVEGEFSDHVIDWFEKKNLDGADCCRLLAHLLCANSCMYGYSEDEFAVSADGLKVLFKHMKKKHKKFYANKS